MDLVRSCGADDGWWAILLRGDLKECTEADATEDAIDVGGVGGGFEEGGVCGTGGGDGGCRVGYGGLEGVVEVFEELVDCADGCVSNGLVFGSIIS